MMQTNLALKFAVGVAHRETVLSQGEPGAGLSFPGEEQRNLVGPRHLRGDAVAFGSGDPLDGESGRRVTQLGEGAVPHRQEALGVVLGAGDGEVPGDDEVVAWHARICEVIEQLLHVPPATLDRFDLGAEPVAVRPERVGRLDRNARRIDEAPEPDHDAVALGKRDGRSDEERRPAGFVGAAVELRPVRDPLRRRRVPHHDRAVLVERCLHVGDRSGPRRRQIEIGDHQDRCSAGTEAVGSVPFGGVDVGALGVGGQ